MNPISTNPEAAAACGIGSAMWWNTDRKPNRGDGNNLRNPPWREDFQIQDLIVKLSNTNLPITKSMTCNKTCKTTANDDSSDEENNMPVVAHPCYSGQPHDIERSKYSPYGRFEDGMVLLDSEVVNNHRSKCRIHEGDSVIPRRLRRKQGTPRYVYPVEDTADEMSSLAATAANEILDCMDSSPLVTASAPNIHYPPHGTRLHSTGQHQRQSSLSTCTNFPAIEVPLSESPHVSNGKILMRGICSQDVTMESTQHATCTFDTSLPIPRKGQREIDYWKQRLDQSDRTAKPFIALLGRGAPQLQSVFRKLIFTSTLDRRT